MYFGGYLPMCAFSLLRSWNSSQLGRYTYKYDRRGRVVGRIAISDKVNWTEEALREVIVHEMIHHYLQAIKHKSGGIFGHNWRFRKECRRLKKEHGLRIRPHCYHLRHLRKKQAKYIDLYAQ